MRILALLLTLQEIVPALERGCDCDYDLRCTNCRRILEVKKNLKSLTPEDRAADLETVEALENILPSTTTSKELINQLRVLINAGTV